MTASLSSVNQISHTQRGKNVGTIIGAGAGTAYMLKNGKDIFINGIQKGLQGTDVSPSLATPIGVGVSILSVGILTGMGRLIGAGIGKIADTIEQHKAQKKLKEEIAETISQKAEELNNIEPISVGELEEMLETEE